MQTFHRFAAAVLIVACTGETSSNTAKGSQSDTIAAPWYHQTRMLDLTGDGTADSIRLAAVGAHADSLRVTLSFVVAGETKHQESWGSSYELALVDSTTRSGASADSALRARLDRVLASVVVGPLPSGKAAVAEDRATLATLTPRPTQRVSFAYGYETTVRLVWDAPRNRFVKLWSCC